MPALVSLIGALLLGLPAEPVAVAACDVEASCTESWDADTIGPADVPKDAPRFADHPAKVVRIARPAAPDVHSTLTARRFRTMIRYEAANGPDFAGHYTLMQWGCGAGCSLVAIEDALTGKLFFPRQIATIQDTNVDPAIENRRTGRIDYRLDSRLIVIPGTLNEDERTRGIHWFTWDRRSLALVRFVPHRLRAQAAAPSTP